MKVNILTDRECYEPVELFCEELVQLRAYSEGTNRKPTLPTNEEVLNSESKEKLRVYI